VPDLGWLEYDGVEVACDERAARYADTLGCGDGLIDGEFPGVGYLVGTYWGDYPSDDGGYGPAGRAPWFDASVAEQEPASVIGFLLLALDGVARSPRTRTVTPSSSGDGGVPGVDTAGPREVEARVAIIGGNEQACEWAVNWLADVFTHGRPTAPADNNDTVLPPRWGLAPRPTGLAGPLRFLAAGAVAPESLRTLYDVVLTEGPAVEAVHRPAGVVVYEVSFTLTAAAPYIYRPAVAWADGVPFVSWPHAYGTDGNPWAPGNDRPITWVMSRDRKPMVRGVDADNNQCNAGPLSGCPDPVTIPDPIVDFDACAATTPMVPTWAPLGDLRVNTTGVYPAVPSRGEVVPIVVVNTGSSIMRRFSVRIGRRLPGDWHDPTGLGLMWELNVPFLPANARLILDGRTGTAVVHCSGSAVVDVPAAVAIDAPTPANAYEPAAYGIRSGPIVWPVFEGHEDLRFTAHAEDDWCAASARVSLFLAPRTDTA
jgi:hypothetical protein